MRKLTLALLVFTSSLGAFSSSALAADSHNSSSDRTVMVFGKFRLLKNGEETQLGTGFFSNVAALRLYRADDQEEFTVRVGENGEFARELTPGDYYVMNISFKYRGETVRPETNFMFNVSDDGQPNYVGTITLAAKFRNGYHGSKGNFDRFLISNECASECERRLAELGLENSVAVTSLPQWQQQVAFSR